jgi:hypothetical protein
LHLSVSPQVQIFGRQLDIYDWPGDPQTPATDEEDARCALYVAIAVFSIVGGAFAMTRRALVIFTVAVAAGLGTSQTPPNTTQLQPAPDQGKPFGRPNDIVADRNGL